jgi:hypothetical protein
VFVLRGRHLASISQSTVGSVACSLALSFHHAVNKRRRAPGSARCLSQQPASMLGKHQQPRGDSRGIGAVSCGLLWPYLLRVVWRGGRNNDRMMLFGLSRSFGAMHAPSSRQPVILTRSNRRPASLSDVRIMPLDLAAQPDRPADADVQVNHICLEPAPCRYSTVRGRNHSID